MLSTQEVNILGQIMDSTWGRSSTVASPTMSLKGSLEDRNLKIIFTTYATFASNLAMSQQVPRLEDEGKQGANSYLKEIKDAFKKEAGRTLKTKVISAEPSIEVISLQPHISPKRTVIFRYVTLLEID